jgi:hypothetical protein
VLGAREASFRFEINVDKGIMTEHIKIPVFEDLLGQKIIR